MGRRVVAAALVATALAGFGASPAFAAPRTTVVPAANATVEGNSDNVFPFSCGGARSIHYQQVYAGSEVGKRVINRLAFRPDGGLLTNPFGPAVLPDVTIILSTTQTPVDGLSTTFADNLGPKAKTVYRGDLTLQSAVTGEPPYGFDIVVPLQRSFNFKPKKTRNLLVDISIPVCADTTLFDFEYAEDDSVSRLFALDATSTTGSTDTGGLVTRFR